LRGALAMHLRLLGDSTRLRILRLLAERPLSVGELRKLLDTSQSAVSQQLAKLRAAGWVDAERRGQHVLYRLDARSVPDTAGELRAMFRKPLSEIPLLAAQWSRWRALFGDTVAVTLQPERAPEVLAARGRPARVLFLCVGNSARSQMAEGFARALGSSWLRPASAGLEPAGLHPMAVAVMAEAGIDISRQTSKPVSPELLDDADLVVTLCGGPGGWRPGAESMRPWRYWPLPDPARASGARYRRLARFREVRDLVRGHVERLLDEWRTGPGASEA
jgi:arsenate reductase